MLKNSISLAKAKTQVGKWRQYFATTYNAYPSTDAEEKRKHIKPDGKETFRGFRVSIDDLKALYEVINDVNKDQNDNPIDGIRIYLAKGYAGLKPDNEEESDMHVLIVPVTKDGKDMLEAPGLSTHAGESTIFDFSSPCPATCDLDSPLY
ncbi:hypothetical protein ACTJIJ_13875 [Niabella sp. 22666]|uniref:hypothetical protein n=1 Tax=Niabella sp. 22666 TaxID=3453954 RepID=UPI003F875A1E